MATLIPDRSLEQRMLALALANEIRSARAELKRELAGGLPVAPLIADPPEYALTMKLFELLMAQRGRGRVRVVKTLARVGVSHSKTLGGLSVRQRAEVIRHLGRREAPVTPSERERRIACWCDDRTLSACNDDCARIRELPLLRERAERAEAAAREVVEAQTVLCAGVDGEQPHIAAELRLGLAIQRLRVVLDQAPPFSGEEGTEG